MASVAESGPSCLGSQSVPLLGTLLQICVRLFSLKPPVPLTGYEFLCDFSKVYPKKHSGPAVAQLFNDHGPAADASLTSLKKLLVPHLEAGIKGDLRFVESSLVRLNPLLHVSPHACALYLAGSDFMDGLVACFRVMNPPLRKVIITTVYLCLVGIVEDTPPKWAMMNDQLYYLKSVADSHKAGPTSGNDSLVAELVTSTPILKVLQARAEASDAATDNFKKRIAELQAFRKGPMVRPKRLKKRKVDKGKGKQTSADAHAEMHVHKMSQITQVQDLFPDLGAGFVSKCLDEYGDDVEQVVANLLSETLPPHLASADRSEPLYVSALTITRMKRLCIMLTCLGRNEPTTMTCRTWHPMLRRLSCRPGGTSMMTTTLIVSQWTYQRFHLERTLRKLQKKSLQPPPTRLLSSLPSRPSTLMTTNVTTLTMPLTSVGLSTRLTRKPMAPVMGTRRCSTEHMLWTTGHSPETLQQDGDSLVRN